VRLGNEIVKEFWAGLIVSELLTELLRDWDVCPVYGASVVDGFNRSARSSLAAIGLYARSGGRAGLKHCISAIVLPSPFCLLPAPRSLDCSDGLLTAHRP